jgi:hypothetical protein
MSGDLVIDGGKDIATTNSRMQEDVQQVYIRLMTEPGDFQVYPSLGVDLSLLYGMPQTKETGDFGKKLIQAGLQKEGLFKGKNIRIEAIPISKDSIRFDVHVIYDTDQPITLSVSQNIGE